MKQHQYQVTVKHLADIHGQPSEYTEALQFNTRNHDDIFKIVAIIQQSQLLDDESAQSFAVGLKLFGETLLENKDLPLFKDFMPQFLQFMKALKQTVKTAH
ncbi:MULTISPECIES: DUF3861 domain-containing protein [unclassified Acinetobacter]|uniref:DUF3861 domain-containing protein n=1 Tax=unclassified Acinetobacter TaxID=196816 RepID=UPI00293502C5|nr:MULTISPECIES: DUF3861 domain-containing protein [unclassified Acinetobacter]WOE32690.1 DUF3861 domain-containing protein [Acinetobacter sp. SAAs470]WOE38166.1 DUF3861 domain-containing protein [Acinetobacter sp. SAAs474]